MGFVAILALFTFAFFTVSGTNVTVDEIHVTVNQEVKAGDILFTIIPDDKSGTEDALTIHAPISGTVATIQVGFDDVLFVDKQAMSIRNGSMLIPIIITTPFLNE